jgi:hypothetical protein
MLRGKKKTCAKRKVKGMDRKVYIIGKTDVLCSSASLIDRMGALRGA